MLARAETRGCVAGQGFSVLELMVTLGILAILIMATSSSVLTTMRNAQIRSVTSAWRDGLAQARNEAIRLNAQVTFCPNGATDWYINLASTNCNVAGALARYDAGATLAARVQSTLTQNATATYDGTGRMVPLSGKFVVQFTPVNGQCLGANGGDVRCLSVEATGGYIRTCDPAAPATSPVACTAGG